MKDFAEGIVILVDKGIYKYFEARNIMDSYIAKQFDIILSGGTGPEKEAKE